MPKTIFRFWINWDGTGVFSAGDEVSAYIMAADWFLGTRGTFRSMADESTANLTLVNTDMRFTPSNPASPLYGNIKPYRKVKIEADYNGTVVTVWTGFLDLPSIGWQPIGELTGKDRVTFSCVGIKQLIDRVQINLGLYTSVTGDVIVTDALNAALGAPVVDIETGATTFALYGDTSGDAWKVIQEISDGERAFFWTARDGTLTWWNRHHKIQNTTIKATLNGDTDKVYGLIGADYKYGDDLANVVRVTITPRQTGTSQVLWSLDAPMTIRAGTTESIKVTLRKDGGQYVAASSLSASPTWASGTASITVDELGGTALVTITNSGTESAILSALTLTGTPTQAQNSITVEESDAVSIAEIGRREWTLSLAAGGGHDDAKQIALYELGRRGELKKTLRAITMKEVPNEGQSLVFTWMAGERYRITIDELFVDEDYWCVGERHQWRAGNEHQMTFYLESAHLSQFWLLGITGQSELGVTTRLVY